MMLDVQHENHF